MINDVYVALNVCDAITGLPYTNHQFAAVRIQNELAFSHSFEPHSMCADDGRNGNVDNETITNRWCLWSVPKCTTEPLASKMPT